MTVEELRNEPAQTPYAPMTLADLAGYLVGEAGGHARRWLLVLEFLEELQHETVERRLSLIAAEPDFVDRDRWDVLLGALCEYVAIRNDGRVPAWCTKPERLWCGRAWFLSDLPSVRACALSNSPASFRARGIFLEPEDLGRDGRL